MDKVNEFEHKAKMASPYNVSRSFQQLYGPEANFSYRARYGRRNSVRCEEAAGDDAGIIMKSSARGLAALDDYMKARNTAIYNDETVKAGRGGAVIWAAHDFAKNNECV